MRATQWFACCSALSLALVSGRAADRKELKGAYEQWMKQDAAYIISDEERQAFGRLQNDEEREQFIEQFWQRRDPTPGTLENEFKEEHYRRIAYANEHYASGLAGWRTDRGRIYIAYGPPDEIQSYAAGSRYERPSGEGGGSITTYPFEQWRYRYLESVGTNIVVEFVDPTMTGEFRMSLDPAEKDALQHVPNASPAANSQPPLSDSRRFERLRQYADLLRPPAVKFRDLEALVTSTVRFNTLPMKVRADYLRMTDSTVLTPVTVQFDNSDLQFKGQEGVLRATVNLYLRITSLTRRVVSVQEEAVTVEQASQRSAVFQKAFFLAPGTYRLNVVAKDVNGGGTNNVELALHVPQFEPGKLAASNIILADLIERVPARTVGSGQFVLGDRKVRPRVSESFRRDERMGIYMQVYEMAGSEAGQKPNGTLEYQVTKSGSNEAVLSFVEEMSALPDASAHQVTIERMLPLASLEPGDYMLKIVITDRNRRQVLTPEAKFSVR